MNTWTAGSTPRSVIATDDAGWFVRSGSVSAVRIVCGITASKARNRDASLSVVLDVFVVSRRPPRSGLPCVNARTAASSASRPPALPFPARSAIMRTPPTSAWTRYGASPFRDVSDALYDTRSFLLASTYADAARDENTETSAESAPKCRSNSSAIEPYRLLPLRWWSGCPLENRPSFAIASASARSASALFRISPAVMPENSRNGAEIAAVEMRDALPVLGSTMKTTRAPARPPAARPSALRNCVLRRTGDDGAADDTRSVICLRAACGIAAR